MCYTNLWLTYFTLIYLLCILHMMTEIKWFMPKKLKCSTTVCVLLIVYTRMWCSDSKGWHWSFNLSTAWWSHKSPTDAVTIMPNCCTWASVAWQCHQSPTDAVMIMSDCCPWAWASVGLQCMTVCSRVMSCELENSLQSTVPVIGNQSNSRRAIKVHNEYFMTYICRNQSKNNKLELFFI